MKNIIRAFALFLLLPACKEKQDISNNTYHLDENTMEKVLTDIVLAEGNSKVLKKYGYRSELLLDSSYQFIYKKQKIEKWQMDSSFKYYANHPDDFTKIMENVIENLNHLEN